MLFRIGDTDYTRKIRQGSYKINAYDVYKEWQDANANIHREIIKQRISGSFNMYFATEADFTTFLNDINQQKDQRGYYWVYLWVNNTHESNTRAVYLDFRPTREQKVIGQAWFPEMVVTVQGV